MPRNKKAAPKKAVKKGSKTLTKLPDPTIVDKVKRSNRRIRKYQLQAVEGQWEKVTIEVGDDDIEQYSEFVKKAHEIGLPDELTPNFATYYFFKKNMGSNPDTLIPALIRLAPQNVAPIIERLEQQEKEALSKEPPTDIVVDHPASETNTDFVYDEILETCKELFANKLFDYGASWRMLRMHSILDQIMIKAKRIRSIQEKKVQKVEDSIVSEWIGIANYAVVAIIQFVDGPNDHGNDDIEELGNAYDKIVSDCKALMQKKNHDYGEAFRDLQPESFVDFILVKLKRIRQIIDNGSKPKVSEPAVPGLMDIFNYAMFQMILIRESTQAAAENTEISHS